MFGMNEVYVAQMRREECVRQAQQYRLMRQALAMPKAREQLLYTADAVRNGFVKLERALHVHFASRKLQSGLQ